MAKGWSLGGLISALKSAAFKDVAAEAELKAGIGDNVPSVEAVMSLIPAQLFNSDFNGSLATQDSIRIPDIPGGLIIKFGIGNLQVPAGTITLNEPFPTKFCGVVATKRGIDGRYVSVVARTINPLGSFNVYGFSNAGVAINVDSFTWIALGY